MVYYHRNKHYACFRQHGVLVFLHFFRRIFPCKRFKKILAVVVAVSSFLWFKNIDIVYSKLINSIGASTFGVLLIHANSDAMRQWLWIDTVNCVGHYDLPPLQLTIYIISSTTIVFIVCIMIDKFRFILIEKPLL